MIKQDQFLYIVQTVILANGTNLTSQSDLAEKYRHVYSASGVLGLMDNALWASERIPDTMTAFEAANEFCSFSLPNLREPEEKPAESPCLSAAGLRGAEQNVLCANLSCPALPGRVVPTKRRGYE